MLQSSQGNHAVNRIVLKPLVLAIHISLASATALSATQAYANTTIQHYQIHPTTLRQALNAFALQAGVNISMNSDQMQNIPSQGLSGQYSLEQGFAELLKNTNFRIQKSGNGYVLIEKAKAQQPQTRDMGQLTTIDVAATGTTAQRSNTMQLPIIIVESEDNTAYTVKNTSTATGLNLSLKETPQSVSIITSQRIEDQGLVNATDVLKQTPGIYVSEASDSRYTVQSRGYAISTYQLDGVNTHSIAGGTSVQNAAQNQDMVIYERVEVLRGASGLLTGAGDPAGTVNFVRKRPTSEFQAYTTIGLGSWDKYNAEFDISGALNQQGSIRGRLVGSYQDSDSYIDYYNSNKKVIYGIIEADITNTLKFTLGVDHEQLENIGSARFMGGPLLFSNLQRTDFSPSKSWSSKDDYLKSNRSNIFTSIEQQLSDHWKIKASANFTQGDQENASNNVNAWNGLIDQLTGDGLGIESSFIKYEEKQKSLDIHLNGNFELFNKNHEVILGYSYLDHDRQGDLGIGSNSGVPINIYKWNHQTDKPSYIGSSDVYDNLVQKIAYLAGKFEISPDLKLILGSNLFSYESNDILDNYLYDYYSASSTSEDNIFTPYVGLTYDLNQDHSIYASYTTIYKPQSVKDKNGIFIDAREGANYELGLKSEFAESQLTSNIALYQIKQDNLAVADAGQIVQGTINEQAYRAIDGAKTQGIDLELIGNITPDWKISTSYTYSSTEDAAGERLNTTNPRRLFKLWTTYRLPNQWNKLTIGGGLNWQSKMYFTTEQWWLPENVYIDQKAYTTANLHANYQFNPKLSATFNVNNITDKKAFTALDSTFLSGNYNAPRSINFRLKYQF